MNFLRPSPDAPAPTQTAVIALVPEAESLVGNYRQRLDASAVWGVPAHVTVLLPFIAPHEVDEQVLATLTAAVVSVPAFDCRFTQARWFGHDVLYLAPEPSQSFGELTAAVWRAFPQYPPYGGAYEDVVPHLTVADRRLADRPTLQAAESAVQAGLPVTARIGQAVLVAGTQAPASWRVIQRLSLGAAVSSART